MTETDVRLGMGLMVMAAACGVAHRTGDRPVRQTAVLVGVCWGAATLLELATGRTVEPVIAADVAAGLGLLVLVWFTGRPWLWGMIAAQAALFFLHAYLYQSGAPPSPAELIGNNILALTELGVMVGAGLRARAGLRGRRIFTEEKLSR